MMAAASCSVGIIPFHRPRLPYLNLSSYSPASDLVGSSRLSHVNVSSLACRISIQQVSSIDWKKNSVHRTFIQQISSVILLYAAIPCTLFSLFYFYHHYFLPLISIRFLLNSARNVAAGKSSCKGTLIFWGVQNWRLSTKLVVKTRHWGTQSIEKLKSAGKNKDWNFYIRWCGVTAFDISEGSQVFKDRSGSCCHRDYWNCSFMGLKSSLIAVI